MTPDGWRQLASLIGRPVVDDASPHVEYATVDSIRHFARAYGDGNPLYSDPDYAAAGPRRALVAPPLFPIATGAPFPPGSRAGPAVDVVDVLGDDGGEPVVVADAWTLHRPIVAGTRLLRSTVLQAVSPGAAGVEVTIRRRYLGGGILYATENRTRRYGLPAHDGSSPTRAVYRADELAAIDAERDQQPRRRARPRWIEGVAVGERLGPMVKGPLTITDLVEYRAGIGPGPLGAAALDLARLHRAARPALYSVDASNVPDTVERRHWDEEYARSLGHPSVYDYSHTRLTWFSHLLTDWMGDGGWLLQLSASMTANNYLGDTHWLEGTVATVDDSRVGIELRGRNQRDLVTCVGSAVVLLPERPADVARWPLT